MEHTVNDALEFVLSLTPHVRKDDVPSAILILLIELGFQTSADGFGYLRKAIFLRYQNPDMRASSIYLEIARTSTAKVSRNQVDQAIMTVTASAWETRDSAKWDYFFSEKKMRTSRKPTNKEFIAEMGCIMELWKNCSKGGSYGTQ